MKIMIRILSWMVVAFLIVAEIVLGPYVLRVQQFASSPADGYQVDFYLYVSPEAERPAHDGKAVTILVQPNNSGTNSDDPAVHRKDAWWTGFGCYRIANELGVVLLIPALIRPGEDWFIYTRALDRDTLATERADLQRIDLQLIAMVDGARSKLAAKLYNTIRLSSSRKF